MNKILFTCCMLFLTIFPVQSQNDEDIYPESQLVVELQVDNATILEWSPDGELLAVVAGTRINIYNAQLELVRFISMSVDKITTLHWSPDGKYLAAKGFIPATDEPILIWDVAEAKSIENDSASLRSTSVFVWEGDGQHLLVESFDEVIYRWNIFDGTSAPIVQILPIWRGGYLFTNSLLSMDVSPDGTNLVTAIAGDWLINWNLDTGLIVWLHEESDFSYPDFSVARWSPDGKFLATDYYILADTGEPLRIFERHWEQPVWWIDWHPSSDYFAVRFQDYIEIYDMKQAKTIQTIPSVQPDRRNNQTIDWHPNEQWLAATSNDGYVRIWQVFKN